MIALLTLVLLGAPLIRDVRPTTIESGDTLVIEAAGIAPGRRVEVTIAAGDLRLVRQGESARGDRVLVDFGTADARELGARTLRDARVEVREGGRAWRLPDGVRPTLELFPASTRRLAAGAGEALGWAPPLATAAVVLLIALVLHLLVAPLTGLLIVWERKISGRMQSRFGPNRVGPSGWLQWLADAVKLIVKEDLTPTDADPLLFRLAPYLKWMSIFATLAVLPLSQAAIVADMNIGLLFLVSITSLTVIAILMGGWASNSKWTLLGGMRSAAQIVSYELPAALALLQVALLAGTLSPQGIVRAQGGLPHQWFVFDNPFAFASFFVYFIAALAEGNRTPFDLPEAESELVAGYATEYSGFRMSVFALGEWTNLYVVGAIAAAGFLGGWNVPFVPPEQIAGSLPLQILSLLVMVAKIVALVFVIIWIRWTLPRFRIDQMMALCWKYLVPIAFATFLGTATWMWLTRGAPFVAAGVRWATFLLGGVAVAGWFVTRVLHAFRSTRLLHTGGREFTWPWVERDPR